MTNEDLIKREIIHQLCIQPLAHSELAKALPENVSKITREIIHHTQPLAHSELAKALPENVSKNTAGDIMSHTASVTQQIH